MINGAMESPPKRVKLQILLRKPWRTPEGIARARKLASSVGITPTTSGAASVAGEIEWGAFEQLFKTKVHEVKPRLPGGSDYGSPGGAAASEPLSVPKPLQECVENITVAPPHIRMADQETA